MENPEEAIHRHEALSPPRVTRDERAALVFLLLLYLCLGYAYHRAVPLFEAPDEPSHIQYIGFIASEWRLPAYAETPDVPGEGMQPPLYYLALAPLYHWALPANVDALEELRRASLSIYGFDRRAIAKNQMLLLNRDGGARFFAAKPGLEPLRLLRLPSLLIGVLAVALTWAAAREATHRWRYALVATSLLALDPQFLFVTSTVNNDGVAVAIGASTLWLAARFIGRAEHDHPQRYYLGLAVLAGVGLLGKTSVMPVLAASALAVFLADARPLSSRLSSAGLCAAGFLLIVSPYLAFNFLHRGDVLGMEAVWRSASHLPRAADFGGVLPYFANSYFDRTFDSYWARFGWMNVLAPTGVHLVFGAICVAGAAGFALVRDGDAGLRRYLGAAFGLSLMIHIGLNLQTAQPQGRHLFGAAPHLATALAIGLMKGAESISPALPRRLVVGLIALLIIVPLYCLVFVIGPAYADGSP